MKISLPTISSLDKSTLSAKIAKFKKASSGNLVYSYEISIDALTNDLLNNDVVTLKFSLLPRETRSPTNDLRKLAGGDLSPVEAKTSRDFSSLIEDGSSSNENKSGHESFSGGYTYSDLRDINFAKNRVISNSILKSHMQLKESIRDNRILENKTEIGSAIVSFDSSISAEAKKSLLRSKMLSSIKSGTGDSISKNSRVSDIFFDGGIRFKQEKVKITSTGKSLEELPVLDTLLIEKMTNSSTSNLGESGVCYERDENGEVVQTGGKPNISRTSNQNTLSGDIERSGKRSNLSSAIETGLQTACWAAMTKLGVSPSQVIPVRIEEFIRSASNNREGLASDKQSSETTEEISQIVNTLRKGFLKLPVTSPENLSEISREDLITSEYQTTTERTLLKCEIEVSQFKILDSEEIILVIDLFNSEGRTVETFSTTINHKKNVENLYIVKEAPASTISQSEDGAMHVSILKKDKSADKIILFKKTIDKNTLSQGSKYEKIQEIDASSTLDSISTSILASPGEVVLLRSISVSKDGTLGKFNDAVIRPTIRSSSQLLESNLGDVAISSENIPSGILVEAKGIVGNLASVYFLRKNITLGDRKFTPLMPRGENVVNFEKRTIQMLDSEVFDGHVYEYKCMMVFKNGTEKHSDNSEITLRRIVTDAIKINAQPPVVTRARKSGQYNISITGNIIIPDSSSDRVKAIFDELGLSDLYSSEITSVKQQFDTISLFHVTRFDVKTGMKYNLGVKSQGQFTDSGDSSRGIPAPVFGSEYIYEMEALVRTPNGVLSEISTTQSARNRTLASSLPSVYSERSSENSLLATSVDLPVNFPEKFVSPLAIREGTLSYGNALPSNHSGDPFELGRIGVIKTVRVSTPTHDVRISPKSIKLSQSNDCIVRWSVKGGVENIDHFIILATRNGMTLPIGSHHSQSLRGGFLYVDTSQKQVPGRVTYSIVPILSNFTRGLERKLGSIIIPGDG